MFSFRLPAAALLALFLAPLCRGSPNEPPLPLVAGEAIYRHGVLPGGAPLRGLRAGVEVEGAAAACANCHLRSGLGASEGEVPVPPLTARYLFHSRREEPSGEGGSAMALTAHQMLSDPSLHSERVAYTDTTLARAIRDGVNPEGRELNLLMPRFSINDAAMASLIAYLRQLSRSPSPGVGEETLQFATILTADADPLKRRAMLSVLEPFFGKGNVFSAGQGPPPQLTRWFGAGAHRWQLHVWELDGAPDSWEEQLDERLKREPVFAVLSGVGGGNWEPVHRFCERQRLPCLFPNVDLPVVAEQDFYDVYFSQGVLLEAQLIAARVRAADESDTALPASARGGRLIQVYRRGDIGEKAAAEFREVVGTARHVEDRPLDTKSNAVRQAFSSVRPEDMLVLWLRPADLRGLPARPPEVAAAFVSGLMGGLGQTPLPPAWRATARLTYPFELPEQRKVSMDFALGWMHFKQIQMSDERTQTDTYLACILTAEAVKIMGQDLLRDHLLETLEMHLGTHLVNGYYPRLEIAPGQRFASRGGYLVRFAGPEGTRLLADGAWSIP